jgi:hypothetical protein
LCSGKTEIYAAPEVIEQGLATTKSDVFAFSMVTNFSRHSSTFLLSMIDRVMDGMTADV